MLLLQQKIPLLLLISKKCSGKTRILNVQRRPNQTLRCHTPNICKCPIKRIQLQLRLQTQPFLYGLIDIFELVELPTALYLLQFYGGSEPELIKLRRKTSNKSNNNSAADKYRRRKDRNKYFSMRFNQEQALVQCSSSGMPTTGVWKRRQGSLQSLWLEYTEARPLLKLQGSQYPGKIAERELSIF
jgi:hypothetical protein